MEQLAAVLALGSICADCEEEGCADTLFALLEGDPMYVDVLIQSIHWTGLIDREDLDDESFSRGFSNVPPTKLTPDQSSKVFKSRVHRTIPYTCGNDEVQI